MSLATSVPAFTAALTELGLTDLTDKFNDNGWNTFNAFAFSTSDPQGRDGQAFEKEVLRRQAGRRCGEEADPQAAHALCAVLHGDGGCDGVIRKPHAVGPTPGHELG